MLTTVVGSYPAESKPPTSISEKISDIFGAYDHYASALELAVSDQVNAGINIISDGQIRGDMVEIFSTKIPGFTYEGGISHIIGKINPYPGSIGADDLSRSLKIAKNLSSKFKKNPLNNNYSGKKYGIKGLITGPTTMVLSSRVDSFYNNKKEQAIFDLAYALKNEVESLQKAGAAIIQVDEPFLSTGIANLKVAREAIEIIAKDLQVPLAMHVCGELTMVLDELFNFPVEILDFEFAGNNTNLALMEKIEFEDKMIGFGCINTKTNEIESSEDIKRLLKRGLDIIGEERMMVDPDCGMRMLSRQAAYNKLKNMKEATQWLP